jgi:hypothetical protein
MTLTITATKEPAMTTASRPLFYRTARLISADGQSGMPAGRISVRRVGRSEIATPATLRALRREEKSAKVDFSGMSLSWTDADDNIHSQGI